MNPCFATRPTSRGSVFSALSVFTLVSLYNLEAMADEPHENHVEESSLPHAVAPGPLSEQVVAPQVQPPVVIPPVGEPARREKPQGGFGYYIQLGFWLRGDRTVVWNPGYESHPHLDFSKQPPPEPPHAIELLLKWEQLRARYSSASRSGTPDAQNIDGEIRVQTLSFGANYWATRHIRLTANYLVNMFPESAPATKGTPSQNSAQRAVAPGNTISPGIDDKTRQNAHLLHEVLFRAAVAF